MFSSNRSLCVYLFLVAFPALLVQSNTAPESSSSTSRALDFFNTTTCPIGYYLDASSNCQLCHRNCFSCTGPTEADCRTCAEYNRIFDSYRKKCICNGRTYDDLESGRCLSCHLSCSACVGPHRSECTQCFPDLDFKKVSITGYCQCKPGFYAVGRGICGKCNSDCNSCFGPTEFECMECFNPEFIVQDDNRCGCGSGKALLNVSSGVKCVACPENCLSCQASGICQACIYGLELKDGACKCPSGLYWDTGLSLCTNCPPLCKECKDAKECVKCNKGAILNAKTGVCECDEPYRKLNHEGNKCTMRCEKGFFNLTSEKCEDCMDLKCTSCLHDKTVCNGCNQGLKLDQDNQCLLQCPDGKFKSPDEDGWDICLPCHRNCKTCVENEFQCTSCKELLKLDENNNCIFSDKCPAGSYFSADLIACDPCISHCQECSGPAANQCVTCTADYLLEEGSCVPCESVKGFKINQQNNVCVPICGDGLVRGSEKCDDGNLMNGDGCNKDCVVEVNFECYSDSFDAPSNCSTSMIPTVMLFYNPKDPYNLFINFSRPMRESTMCDLMVESEVLSSYDYDYSILIIDNKTCLIHIDFRKNTYRHVFRATFVDSKKVVDTYYNPIEELFFVPTVVNEGYVIKNYDNSLRSYFTMAVQKSQALFCLAMFITFLSLPILKTSFRCVFWNFIDLMQRLYLLSFFGRGAASIIPPDLFFYLNCLHIYCFDPNGYDTNDDSFDKLLVLLLAYILIEISYQIYVNLLPLVFGRNPSHWQQNLGKHMRLRFFCLVGLPLMIISIQNFMNVKGPINIVPPFFFILLYLIFTVALAVQVSRFVERDESDQMRIMILSKYDELVTGMNKEKILGRVFRLVEAVPLKLALAICISLPTTVGVSILIAVDFVTICVMCFGKVMQDKYLKIGTYLKYTILLVVEVLMLIISLKIEIEANFIMAMVIEAIVWVLAVVLFLIHVISIAQDYKTKENYMKFEDVKGTEDEKSIGENKKRKVAEEQTYDRVAEERED